MRFGVLGPARAVRADGRPVATGGARLRALLAMLLLDAGRTVPVDRLIDGLYGDDPPAGAVNAVQSNVSRLRRDLPVDYDGTGYRLAVDPEEVDAHHFARLAAEGHRALAAGDHERAAGLLRDGLALWRGDALADVRGAPFAAAAAARLTELRRQAAEDRIEAELPGGPSPATIAELRELIDAEPLREHTWALLLRALAAAGRPAEALIAYERARRTLAEELGADPSAELAAAHTAVLRGTAAPARHGLPAQLTSFVGRRAELERVAAALAGGRLVTLLGPGGAGKTRLAVEAAGRHPGEVFFVDLTPVGDAEVPRAVLDALGLRDVGLRDRSVRDGAGCPGAAERLTAALSTRDVLLVLDNCEHVVGAVAALAGRLLAGCPGVRVLATSREPLALTGEVRVPVSGLPEEAAVRLFADRAADVAPSFALTPDNTAAATRICRTLDGLPLAVELAAARLPVLSPTELARRVDDRFALLNAGSRTAAERHRTLHAVVAWSWDLLTGPERALARRFSVFAGGAALDAVESVCGLGARTLDVLAGLVAKSLVERDGDRYRMLETIRAFGAERLAEAGERDTVERAHAAYVLELARTAEPQLRGRDQLRWLARLDADRDNLLAALRRGDPATGLRLVAALSFYWWLRGSRGEAAALAGELLRAVPHPPAELEEEYVLCTLTAALTGDAEPGEHSFRYLLALDRPPAYPFLLYLSAMAAGPPVGDVTTLQTGLRERVRGDRWCEALCAIGFGWMALLFGGDTGAAGEQFAAARTGFGRLGDRWGTMLAQNGLAEVATWRGDHAAALAPMDEALRLAAELGSLVDIADLLRSRADGRLRDGDLAGAAADFARVVDTARACGAPELVAAGRLGLGELAWRRGDHAGARELCTAALAECPAGWFSADGVRTAILATLARIAEDGGDDAEAARRYREVVAAAGGPDGGRARGEAEAALARLTARTGR